MLLSNSNGKIAEINDQIHQKIIAQMMQSKYSRRWKMMQETYPTESSHLNSQVKATTKYQADLTRGLRPEHQLFFLLVFLNIKTCFK